MLRDHESPEALAKGIGIEHFVADALSLDLFLIGRQTNRRRPEIQVLLQSVLGRDPTLVAQCVADGGSDAATNGARAPAEAFAEWRHPSAAG